MLAQIWAIASTALAACLYLLDLGTTISTLVTYYQYEYHCPHAPLPSPLLHDPICRAICYGHAVRAFPLAFGACLATLALAHLTYAFMFWITLPPRQHPLRLAYLMPLIHLYRLVKLFRHSFSSKGLKQLQNGQEESTSLYSALGASLETIPQFLMQFNVACKLGQYLKGSSDPNMQAQRIPTNLILSLVASIVSGVYNTSVAIWFLMRKQHMSLARRACLSTMAGCQTFVIMLAKAMFLTALVGSFSGPFPTPTFIYLALGILVAWIFIYLLMISHHDNRGKSKFVVTLHSLGFALMTAYIGPIYVMIKLRGSTHQLIWGTLLHIFVELIGLTLMFSLPIIFRKGQSPCHSAQITSTQELDNKYLTCKVFLGIIFPSFFVLLLTSLLFSLIHLKSDNPRDTSTAPKDIICYTQKASSSNVSTLALVDIRTFEDTKSHLWSTHNFKRLLLLVMTILFVQKVQRRYVLKGYTNS